MGALTTFFNLFKPAKTDGYNVVQDFNDNFDIIDAEMHKPPLTVNGIQPNPTTRDLTITEVPLAANLSSDIAQVVDGIFMQRMSGGGASIEDGSAFLSFIRGNIVHTGQTDESIEMTVNGEDISATLNRETFVAYVQTSGTITLTYTTAWSADPALYGITVTGTPANGDSIVIEYVKENRGTITPANPASSNSTGWNLFNKTTGYARCFRYSDTYGYKIGGNYTFIEFSQSLNGQRSSLTIEDGYFNVPSDGYVFVTGSDNTTYIYATHTDWTEGYQGSFESYTVSSIDVSEVMALFEYGLCAVGNVRDEINLNTKYAIQRINRLAYTAENLLYVESLNTDYIADENYIYYVLANPTSTQINIDGEYTVSDHGVEFIIGGTVAPVTEVLYGENLKDKLRTDVLTISAQELTSTQKTQVQTNIGAADVVPSVLSGFIVAESKVAIDNWSVAASSSEDTTVSVAKTGYTPLGIVGWNFANATSSGTGRSLVYLTKLYLSGTTATISVRNSTTTAAKVKLTIFVLYRKNLS